MAMTPKLLEGLPASGWRRGAGTIGATLQDIGSSLGSGQEHGQLAKLQADQAALAQQAQVRQEAAASAEELFPGNKMLRFLALSNPAKYMSTVEEYAKPYTAERGKARVFGQGGQRDFMPDYQEFGDQAGTVSEAGAFQPTYTRPMTYGETETGANNQRIDTRAAADRALTQRGQDLGHQVGMANVGVAQGNLGVRQQEYNARLKGVGGFGTPGTGFMNLGPTLGSEWEVQ